jgi:hypothetical protein
MWRTVNWAREWAGSIRQLCASAGAAVRNKPSVSETSIFIRTIIPAHCRASTCLEASLKRILVLGAIVVAAVGAAALSAQQQPAGAAAPGGGGQGRGGGPGSGAPGLAAAEKVAVNLYK